MQIVGELSNTIDLNSLQGIYRKGGKVANSFEDGTRLGDICSILLTEGMNLKTLGKIILEKVLRL